MSQMRDGAKSGLYQTNSISSDIDLGSLCLTQLSVSKYWGENEIVKYQLEGSQSVLQID